MRTKSISRCLALVAVALVPAAAVAQTPSVAPGTRVRVTSTALHLDHVEGLVQGVRGDTLAIVTPYRRMVLGRVVDDTATHDIPLNAVDGLQLSSGRVSNVGRGAGIGVLVGAGVGGLIGLAAMASTNGGDYFNFGPEAIPMGMLGGGLTGLVAGSLIGAMSTHEVWQDVSVPSHSTAVTLHVGRGPLGGQSVGVGMAIRF